MARRVQPGVSRVEDRPEHKNDVSFAQTATDHAQRSDFHGRSSVTIFPAHQLEDISIPETRGLPGDDVPKPSRKQFFEERQRGVIAHPIAKGDLVNVDVAPWPLLLVDDLQVRRTCRETR